MTEDDEDIIDPIDYPTTLSLKQYKAAQRAVDLIEPVERNQTPRRYGSLWRGTISDNSRHSVEALWGSAISDNSRHSTRDVCRTDVEDSLWDISFALFIENFYAFGRTKADKGQARQIAKALRRVDDLVRGFNKPNFPLVGFPFDELRKWKHVFAKMGEKPSEESTRLNALKKRLAVAEAYQLLQKYGSKRVTATKGGKFCRLTALLYGDPEADLINQCKAHIRAPTSTAAEHTEQARVQRNAKGEKSGAK
jgi:hypothetical protein